MKFQNITFPIFILNKVPDEVKYTHTNISIIIDKKEYILDCAFGNLYTDRLINIRSKYEHYVLFNATIFNIQQLIRSDAKWGIDNKGKIFDLSKKEIFPFKCAKIDKVRNNLMWVKGISYPFEFKYGIVEKIDKFVFAHLVKIYDTWYIYDLSYKYSNLITIRI